jgi:hypothetical protein
LGGSRSPEVGAVGLTTEEQTRKQGVEPASVVVDLPSSIAGPYTFQETRT